MKRQGLRICGAAAAVALLLAGAPAAAEDEEEKLGLAAGLGLTAATGKTTIAEGGGAVEAALLTSDAVREAGRVIAALATKKANGRDVLVLSRAEQVNLIADQIVRGRIDTVKRALQTIPVDPRNAKCRKVAAGGQKSATEGQRGILGAELGAVDIGAALATDTTYSPIKLDLEDRMLIAAVGMSGTGKALDGSANWIPAAAGTAATHDNQFIIPSEIVFATASQLMNDYKSMMQQAATIRLNCTTDEAKAAVALADAVSKELTTPGEKTGISPLGAALQTSAAMRRRPGDTTIPLVLRVAIEQTGGTAITRGNIWYTLGFPGAATVSSGLLASYRLVDPASGVAESAGFVRCVIAPVSMSNVHLVVNEEAQNGLNKNSERGKTYCSYIATT